jgi:hypothetical protein
MIDEQVIFLDETDLNPLNGSLIDPGTTVLNLIIDDGTPSTDCYIIGNKFEWRPFIWMLYEMERINRLDKLRIVVCGGVIGDDAKKYIRSNLDVEIEFFELLIVGSYQFFVEAQGIAKNYHSRIRDINVYYSAGTMRLTRYFLAHWLQEHNIDFGRPRLAKRDIESFSHQLQRISVKDLSNYNNVERRFFGHCDEGTYNDKHVDIIQRSKICMVAEYPFFDWREAHYDEKFTHVLAAKSIPFFFGNKNDNANIELLGFRPYVGIDYSADKIQDFAERWQMLLDSNKNCLLDVVHMDTLYEQNKSVIDYNFDVLIRTDWKEIAWQKVNQLPLKPMGFIKDRFFK